MEKRRCPVVRQSLIVMRWERVEVWRVFGDAHLGRQGNGHTVAS